MNTKNFKLLTIMLLIVALVASAYATCTYSETNNSTTANLNETADVTITMAANQKWDDFTSITPSAVFNHVVYENLVGQTSGTNYTLTWKAYNDTYTAVNSTFALYNGTTLIARGNYTITSTNNKTFYLVFASSTYNGSTLLASFNRTFTPVADNLYTNLSGMNTLYSLSSFLQTNTPSDYGDSKTLRANPATYAGDSINNTNWVIAYKSDDVDCGAVCENHVNTLLLNVIVTMFLLGMLVFIAYSAMNGADSKAIIGLVVAFIIMLIMAAVLNSVVSGVCVV